MSRSRTDEFGGREGEPVVLIAGCGQPATAWQVGVAPALVRGSRVVTFDNRGVAPSSSPPADCSTRWSPTRSASSTTCRSRVARIVGALDGWVDRRDRSPSAIRSVLRAAAFLGSCNPPTSWEKAITTVERDLARLDYDLPPLFYATETLRYLPNKDLQDDSLVDTWLMFTGDQEPWPNPGRLGQYEACLRVVDRSEARCGVADRSRCRA